MRVAALAGTPRHPPRTLPPATSTSSSVGIPSGSQARDTSPTTLPREFFPFRSSPKANARSAPQKTRSSSQSPEQLSRDICTPPLGAVTPLRPGGAVHPFPAEGHGLIVRAGDLHPSRFTLGSYWFQQGPLWSPFWKTGTTVHIGCPMLLAC